MNKTTEEKKMIKISVRNFVEFLLKSGDIDHRRTSGSEKEAMQLGSRIHRKIQKQMGVNYRAEVPLKYTEERNHYQIEIKGRADGVLTEGDTVIIDEIKGVYRLLSELESPLEVHLAQARCYGYFYCLDHALDEIGIQVTYCNMEHEDIRRFFEKKTREELKEWFDSLLQEYDKWAEYLLEHEKLRNVSLKGLEFPYEYRAGQKELAISVYRAISRGKNLFIQAPTGIGKTISTIYPALKAIGEGIGSKLFYLTAKTITRSVAEDTFDLLGKQGLCFHTITITAKEKICPMQETVCNPDACPYAKGHFDRVNDAVYEIICKESKITRETVLDYAERFMVCPFEYALDISEWVDGIICDYNYVFDPNAKLKRYFGDQSAGDYLFLIDEAHNLVHRAREMYSAALLKEDFLLMKKIFRSRSKSVTKSLERCNQELLRLKRECETYQVLEQISLFASHLMGLYEHLEAFLEEEREFSERDLVLDFYFSIRHFLNMYDGLGEHYQIYTELLPGGSFQLKLFCVDPSVCLAESLQKGKSSVFFSATLLPVRYYKKLLTGAEEDYAVYAHSPFDAKRRLLLIGSDVTSRYTKRNRMEYDKILDYIDALTISHKGNYLVFFPSHQYLEAVEKQIQERECRYRWKTQGSHMDEEEREAFLTEFQEQRRESLVGLCVLGGIFSEGIDLREESLEGVIIVGTGLPMVCTEQEILKDYFDGQQEDGYDYAYQYPGMNKVMQAAGRVIRTAQDRGVILLLDDRFLRPRVQELFPREWSEYGIVTRNTVQGWLEQFWRCL